MYNVMEKKGRSVPMMEEYRMKKIAMLLALALMLCAMMTTAMAGEIADFTIPATAEDFGYYSNIETNRGGKFSGKHRLEFWSDTDFREDWTKDAYNCGSAPVTPGETELTEMLKNAMYAEISKNFAGIEFKYMFYDVEATTQMTIEGGGDEWYPMDVPKRNKSNQSGVWAESVTGTLGYKYFGGAVDQVVAYYAEFETPVHSNNLKIEKVKSVEIVNDGVKMTFNHLSPVMIAWTNKAVAAPVNVPQTGDSSSLPGLFILLGMSVAAFGVMKLRRREN